MHGQCLMEIFIPESSSIWTKKLSRESSLILQRPRRLLIILLNRIFVLNMNVFRLIVGLLFEERTAR